MEKKKLVPKRRFRGFQENWRPLKINNIFNVLDGDRGSNYPGESDFYKTGHTLFLDTGNVTKKGFDFSTKKYITRKKDELLRSGKLEIDDFVLTSRGTLGNVAFYGKKEFKKHPSIRINSAMLILRQITSEKISSTYMESVLRGKVIESFMKKKFVGSAQPHITKRDFSNLDLCVPYASEEQQKIGEFFKVLDESIANQERKIAKVKALKSAYLTEMFPQEGETVPKRRFKGFKGEWESGMLGDFGTVEMNKRIFKWQTSSTGDVPFYKIGTFGQKADAFISYDIFKEYKLKYPYPKIGDILISASGSIGKTIEYKGEDEYFQDSNIVWLKHDGRLNNLFLKQFYKIVKWSGLEGSTIQRLYNKDILGTYINIPPTYEEQQKIGQLFKNLDDQIATEEKKLEKLKKIKEAYLEEMFV